MLYLSSFELHSRWLPLFELSIDSFACELEAKNSVGIKFIKRTDFLLLMCQKG